MSTLNPTPNAPKPAAPDRSFIPESAKLILLLILFLAVVFLYYDRTRLKKTTQAQIAGLSEQIQALENNSRAAESNLNGQIASLRADILGTQEAVGSTKAELQKTAAQIQAEGQRTRRELSQALSTKADAALVEAKVQAAKTEAESKIGQVSSEVGGVKTEVTAVKTDLAATRRDLEGTQRQLIDVRETLSSAIAKNSTELAQLRLKGERLYTEFILPKKDQVTRVEDIRLVLTKTDRKKGKFNLKILVDDSQLEKKDRVINEPIQFLVGQDRLRYEVVINWVEKDRAGGYLSVPKDKALAAERPK